MTNLELARHHYRQALAALDRGVRGDRSNALREAQIHATLFAGAAAAIDSAYNLDAAPEEADETARDERWDREHGARRRPDHG